MTGVIKGSEIKMRQAVRNNSTEFNGGFMSRYDVDPNLNSQFRPVSLLDAKAGHVALVKDFILLNRLDDEPMQGLIHYLAKPSKFDNVRYTLIEPTAFGDEQKDIKEHMQGYIGKGYHDIAYALLGSTLVGSKKIIVYGEEDSPEIDINSKFCLQDAHDDDKFQFIHVTDVDARLDTVMFENGPYTYKRQELTLNQRIEHVFTGDQTIFERMSSRHRDAKILTVSYADAVRFFGIKPLVEAIQQGQSTVKVTESFEQVIPTSSSDKAYTNQALVTTGQYIQTGEAFELPRRSNTAPCYLGTGVMPGSVQSSGWQDNYEGVIKTNGNDIGVDYARGVLTAGTSSDITVTPAVYVPAITKTASIPITATNVGSTFVVNPLRPLPSAGSIFVAVCSNGKWDKFYDRGDGQCFSNGNQVFAFDYVSGTGEILPPFIPDIGTEIIVGWSSSQMFRNFNDTVGAQPPIPMTAKRAYQLDPNIKQGSLTIAWDSGENASETGTADADGWIAIAGDFTGRYNNISGRLEFDTIVPAKFIANYIALGKGGAVTATGVETSGMVTFDFGQTIDWANNDFVLEIEHDYSALGIASFLKRHVYNKGSKGVTTFTSGFRIATTVKHYIAESGGFVDYKVADVSEPSKVVDSVVVNQKDVTVSADGLTCTMYLSTGESQKSKSFDVADKMLGFKLTSSMPANAQVVPSSLILKVGNDILFDRNGELHKDIDPKTGAGTRVGSFNYATTEITLRYETDTLDISVLAGVMQIGIEPIFDMTWFTPRAPIQTGSLSITAIDLAGNEVIGTSGTQNNITGGITGTYNAGTGIYRLHSDVGIRPESVRFNYVGKLISPIDSATLGVDTSRFPPDGRVRIFRAGDTVVVHNTGLHDVSQTISDGTVINLPRGDLDQVCIFDKNHKPVDKYVFTDNPVTNERTYTQVYEIDKDAGTVTFTSAYNEANYVKPITFKHVQFDVATCADVDNAGNLSLKLGDDGISRDYPIDDTYVSSALVKSTLEASVAPVSHLKHWNGDWDDITGDVPVGRYNDDDYPIIVNSLGAIPERWAIEFTGPDDIRIYGRDRGVVYEGNTNGVARVDYDNPNATPKKYIAPQNPATVKVDADGEPIDEGTFYFALRADGFTNGFEAGNVIFFETTGASTGVWNVMSVLIGDAPIDSDVFAKSIIASTAQES